MGTTTTTTSGVIGLSISVPSSAVVATASSAEPRPLPGWQKAAISLTLLLPVLFGLASVVGGLWPEQGQSMPPLFGLRLGIAPSQARAAFAPGNGGRFVVLSEGEDLILHWTAQDPSQSDLSTGSEVADARLEFHLGQLVAVRINVSPSAPESSGPSFELSPASLLTREITADHAEITWLARNCPTHADEVQRRLRSAEQ